MNHNYDMKQWSIYSPVAKDIDITYFREYVLILMKEGDAAAICFLRGCQMDDILAAITLVMGLFFAGMGIVATFTATPDSTIISSCNKNGYWQTGQTRIICYVEEKNE